MAMVNFKKGLLASLPATYAEGTFYVTTDERAIYLDVSDSERIRISDFQKVATMGDLPAASAAVAPIYYIEDINCLAVHNGSEWIQVNRDTGATDIEVTGEGNAVTAASYDAATRKITLTKGATFATKAELDALDKEVEDLVTAGGEPNKLEKVKVNGTELTIDSADKSVNVTVAEGTANGTVAVNGVDVPVKGLGSAAFTEASAYDEAGAAQDVQDALDAYKTTNDEAVAVAKKSGDDAMAEAQKKVASVTAGDGSVTIGGTATAPTVSAKLSADADNALSLAADGLKVAIPAAAEYSIVKAENSGEYAAIYNLTKDGAVVGASINIPKDMVVESGSVVTDPEGQPAGTYIKLVLQNVAEPLFINVGSLIEYVTSGSAAGDMIVINVSDDHKVTATITDGTITLAKLDTDTQTKINKAHDHANKTVLDGIDAAKVEGWDAAEQNAKDYADGLMTWGSF